MNLSAEDVKELRHSLLDFIDKKCIFRANPNIQYSPGIPRGNVPGNSPGSYFKWQFYLRNLTQDSDMASAACMLIMNLMEEREDYDKFQLAGLETSSIPLISFLQASMRRDGRSVNSFIVRKERKGYGVFNLFDGIPNKFPVCVVDDVINSGASVHYVLDTSLYEYDLKPHENMYSIVSLNKNRKFVYFNGTTININSLFKSSDFNFDYKKDNYWIPFDCDKSFNKRPDYF